ncbi:MAG: C40 family peptidase [Verrucomicrobiae bacterium]|nr:C40 family peptidase [Verrucomicrobiae bacterium]
MEGRNRGRGISLCWLAALAIITGVTRSELRADDSRFSVMGWVKSKLTPEEEARSAARADRLRPLGGYGEAETTQTLAMATPVPVPAYPPVIETPNVDQYAAGRMATNSEPIPPSRPVSREMISPPPPVMTPPPPTPEPTVGRPQSAPRSNADASPFTSEATIDELRRRAEYLSSRGLTYKFGGDHPSEGGMDCSGTMQFLLKSMGFPDIPRTSYDQYQWLAEKGTLKKVGFWHSPEKAVRSLRPGDLIFWGGTYDSGHKVSHVMVFLGQSRAGKYYIFGARGKSVKGLNGSGVDIFELDPRDGGGKLVGYGHLPGLKG